MGSVTEPIRIVLASVSPRRQRLLASMGLSFDLAAPNVNEARHPEELPAKLAIRLSLAKAHAVAAVCPQAVIIAADTLVVVDKQVIGKPDSRIAALEMLARLRNRQHSVYSGLTILDVRQSRYIKQVAVTSVIMRDYTDGEIRRYIDSGDPMDKAGAYAIQDLDFGPVARIDGCYANVMGLPMCHLYRALRSGVIHVPVHPLDCCPLAVEKGCCPWARQVLDIPMGAWSLSSTCG